MHNAASNLLGQRYLVFDMSNLLYKTFFVHKNESDLTVAGMAHHTALVTLNMYYKKFRPNKVVMVFDRTSWRKAYTAGPDCLSKRPYKGNRRQKMTPAEKIRYEVFLKHLADFELMIREHTSIIALAGDGLEADDLMSGLCQVHTLDPDNELIIISSDKDMLQLLGYPNVRLVDPSTGKDRTLEEWNGDVEYFLFEKCIRGDAGDNVMSAFPRVKSTRIEKAYKDELDRVNLMQQVWKNPEGVEFTVKDVFKENQLLMDLRKQPDDIQKQIVVSILEAEANRGKFSYFHFLKFLGKYELKKIVEQVDNFVDMLNS
jgi:5'-3' exonuclease